MTRAADPGAQRVVRCVDARTDARAVRVWVEAVEDGDLGEAFDLFYRDLLAHGRVNPAQARQAVDRARRAWARRLDPGRKARLERLLAHVLRAEGDMARADDAYGRAWAGFEAQGDELELGRTAIGWLDVLSFRGRFEQARRVAERGRRALGRRDAAALARLDSNWANSLYLSGRLTQAAKIYRAVHRRLSRAGHERDAALVAWNLGQVLLLQGQVRHARERFLEAREVFEERGFESSALRCRFGLAVADLMEGRWREGLEVILELEEAFLRMGDRRAAAATLWELSRLLGAVGVTRLALRTAERAHDLYQELGLERDAAELSQVMAQWLNALDRPSDARVRLQSAIRFWARSGDRRSKRRAEVEQADCLLRLGQSAKALRELQRLRRQAPRRGERTVLVRCLTHLARAYLEEDRTGWALRTAKEAHRLARRYPEELERPALALLCARAHGRRGDSRDCRRWVRKAVDTIDRLGSELGVLTLRAQLDHRRAELHREAIELVLAAGGRRAEREALDLLGRSLATNLLEDILVDSPDMDRPLRIAISRLRDQLLREGSSDPDDVRTRSATAELDSLERRHPRRPRTQALRLLAERAAIGAWEQKLRGRPLVVLDQHGDEFAAYLVRVGGEVERHELPRVGEVLDRAWSPLRLLLETAAHLPSRRRSHFLERTRSEAEEALLEIRRAILDPLPLTGEESVHLIACSSLEEIPLQALPLLDEETQEGTPTFSRWLHPALIRGQRSRSGDARWAAILSDGRASTRRESEEVGHLLRQAGFAPVELTRRDDLLDRSGHAALLHVAAHGVHHPQEWMLNGIRLEDGWMGFEHLRREQLEDALLYFSSCESGLVSGSAHAGLTGWMVAGLRAAAREMVLTLWKIDDRGARRFAREFYARWTQGLPVAEALRETQSVIRSHSPHPFHWAAFTAMG